MCDELISMIPAIIGLFLTIFGPIVIRGGTRAHHKVFIVWLPDDETSLAQNNSPAGRRAQEIGEIRFWSLVSTVIVAAIGAVSPPDPLIAVALFAMWFVATAIFTTKFGDDAGHGAEILYVEKYEDWPDYRAQEIERMLRDSARKGQTPERVQRSLERWEPVSRIMLFLSSWKVLG